MNCMIHIISALGFCEMDPVALLCRILQESRREQRRVSYCAKIASGDKYHCNTRALMFLTLAESIQNHQKQQPAEIS